MRDEHMKWEVVITLPYACYDDWLMNEMKLGVFMNFKRFPFLVICLLVL